MGSTLWAEEETGPARYSEKYIKALELACQLHKNHYRKGTRVPYIAHLLDVSAIVWKAGGTEEEAIAALLHDAVEDQGGRPTLERIRSEFGDTIAQIVEGCSEMYDGSKPPWQARKDTYIQHLKQASPAVLLVSAADKLSNIQDTLAGYRHQGNGHFERFTAPKERTLWFYTQVVKVFREKGTTPVKTIARQIEGIVGKLKG